MSTFGVTPADVVTDPAGNVLPGRTLQVWTAENGTQITDLTDLDGQPLPGIVTTDDLGRYPFRTILDYGVVSMRDADGNWWDVVSRESLRDLGTAISSASQAVQLVQNLPTDPEAQGAISDNDDLSQAEANRKIINAALEQGDVRIPAGRWWVDKPIRIPSNRTLSGAGIGETWLSIVDGADSNDPVVTNYGNMNVEHSDPDSNIVLSDMTIDGNRTNRGKQAQINENGCSVRWSCVEHVLVERVYALNGIHSFDTSASVYTDDSLAINDPAKRPPGPSRWVTFRDCIAGGSGDDAFTTHNSQYVLFDNCRAINHEAKPRNTYSNGFEVDDGSRDITIRDCYAYGFHAGVQIKGHQQNIPSQRVDVIRTTADHCQYGFDMWWNDMSSYTGPVPADGRGLCRDVWLKDCIATDLQDIEGGTTDPGYHPALRIRSYDDVRVDNFLAYDCPTSNVLCEYGCRNVTIRNIVMEDCWQQPYDTGLALFNLYSSVGDKIIVSGFDYRGAALSTIGVRTAWTASKLPGPILIEDVTVHGDGTADVPAVQMGECTAQHQVRRVQQTGFAVGCRVKNGSNAGDYDSPPIVDGWWS